MKLILKSEEAMMFALSLLLFYQLHFSWMWFWVLFLAPDLGALGYLVNSKTGAFTYNLLHHKGVAVVIYLIGINFASAQLEFAGILLFAHSSFDRILGYGLKYPDGFNYTHLGMIGKKERNT